MRPSHYVNAKPRPDVAQVNTAPGRVDLVIETLDEFALASTGRVSSTCLCATNADYVYGAAARN
jgi:hypothetical protein